MNKPQTVADVLETAACILSDPKAWTRGALALDADGDEVGPISPEATCFCTVGAIARAIGDNSNFGLRSDAHNKLRTLLPTFYISEWNDAPYRTHDEVVAKLREAAAAARSGEAA